MFGETNEKNQQIDSQFDDLTATLPPEPSILGASDGLEVVATSEPGLQIEPSKRATDADDDFQGVELKEYAKREGITVDALWRKIRAGALIARTENGFVYVYGANQPESEKMPNIDRKNEELLARENLPPLPVDYSEHEFGNFPAVQHHSRPVAEVALLLDHLTVAKEESKQVLRLSQESISRITQMSEAIVRAKDELIAQQEQVLRSKDEFLSAHEEQIATLKRELLAKEEANRRLRQEVEDLEMLTRTLGGEV